MLGLGGGAGRQPVSFKPIHFVRRLSMGRVRLGMVGGVWLVIGDEDGNDFEGF